MTEEQAEALHEECNRKWPCESMEASVAECLTLLHNAGWLGHKLSAYELVAIECTMRILRDKAGVEIARPTPSSLVTYEKSGGVRIDLKRYLRWFLREANPRGNFR